MLTILTQPVRSSAYRVAFTTLRAAKYRIRKQALPELPPSGHGHPGVTRSLLHGLDETGYPYRYNPTSFQQVSGTVAVLAGVQTLRQAIRWKRNGKITFLAAGPNIVVLPTEEHGILAAPEIDLCITPAEWVSENYLRLEPRLRGRIRSWAAGVDAEYWTPSQPKDSRKILLYWKTESAEFRDTVERLIVARGWHVECLRYGDYTLAQFKTNLDNATAAVFISRSESQGLALAEAWSMDVPTLVWDPQEQSYQGHRFHPVSACPYLTPQTGATWKTPAELGSLLDRLSDQLAKYQPRQWILTHMTDMISAEQFVSFFPLPNLSS